MGPDLLKWFNQAVAALGRGGTKEEVDPIVTDLTQGRFQSFDQLNEFVQPFLGIEDPERQNFAITSALEAQAEQERAAELDVIAGPESLGPVSGARRAGRNILEAVSQIGTLGFADEALEAAGRATGLEGLEAFGTQQGERQAIRERQEPGATLASEMIPGLLIPTSLLRSGGRRFATRGFGARQGALVGGARAAGAAGAASALATVGFAETEEERSPGQIIRNAGIGALVAGPFGAVSGGLAGALSRKFRNRRVSQRLARGTDLPNMGRESTRKADILEVREAVQEDIYGPLQQQFAEVDDEGIMRVLDGIQDNERVSGVIPDDIRRVGPREITSVGFGSTATGARRVGGSRRRPPSFEELQAMRRDLRAMANSPQVRLDRPTTASSAGRFAEALDEAMGAAFGPELRLADDIWRRAGRNERALDAGWDLWDGKLDDVIRATREMDDEALSFFNRGRQANWQAEIGRGDAARKRFFDLLEQDDRRVALSTMFPGGEEGEAFRTFLRAMRREGWQENARNVLDRLIIAGGVAVSAGIIGGAIGSAGSNNQAR